MDVAGDAVQQAVSLGPGFFGFPAVTDGYRSGSAGAPGTPNRLAGPFGRSGVEQRTGAPA
jgi:hypothetical protein